MKETLNLDGMTKGVTHWSGCHEHHWNCAIRRLETLLNARSSELVRLFQLTTPLPEQWQGEYGDENAPEPEMAEQEVREYVETHNEAFKALQHLVDLKDGQWDDRRYAKKKGAAWDRARAAVVAEEER